LQSQSLRLIICSYQLPFFLLQLSSCSKTVGVGWAIFKINISMLMARIIVIGKNQCCGSGISEFFPSWIPDPRFASKNLSVLTPKKWFLSFRKYDPGSSSRIRILTFYPFRIPDPDPYFLPIPDPGVKKTPDTGSGSATLGKIV
jgi:hypothetical protein